MPPACLLPKVPLAGGQAEVEAHLRQGCQPARSYFTPTSCSTAYAPRRLLPATEVPLAGGHAEVKATCCQGASPRPCCTPEAALRPAYLPGASQGPPLSACCLQCQKPPENGEVACPRRGTSPRSAPLLGAMPRLRSAVGPTMPPALCRRRSSTFLPVAGVPVRGRPLPCRRGLCQGWGLPSGPAVMMYSGPPSPAAG